MGKPTEIYISRGEYSHTENSHCGIHVCYVKKTETLSLNGWFDSFVGIEGVSFPLEEFCRVMGIASKTLRKVADKLEEK